MKARPVQLRSGKTRRVIFAGVIGAVCGFLAFQLSVRQVLSERELLARRVDKLSNAIHKQTSGYNISGLPAEDVERIVEYLRSVRAGLAEDPREGVEIGGILRRWLRRDPVSCLNFLDEIDALGLLSEDDLTSLFAENAASESELFKIAGEVKSGRIADYLLRMAFLAGFTASPEQALNNVKAYPEYMQDLLVQKHSRLWIEKEGPDALRKLVAIPSVRTDSLNDSFWYVAERDVRGALALYREASTGKNEALHRAASVQNLRAILAVLHNSDPETALILLQDLPRSAERDRTISSMIAAVFAKQKDKASETLAALSADGLSPELLGYAAQAIIKTEPEIAMKLAEQIPGVMSRSKVYSYAARSLAGSDPKFAAEWAMSIPGPIDRLAALEAVGGLWFDRNPEGAIAFAAKVVDQGKDPIAKRAIVNMATRISERWESSNEADQRLISEYLPFPLRQKFIQVVTPILESGELDRLRAILKTSEATKR